MGRRRPSPSSTCTRLSCTQEARGKLPNNNKADYLSFDADTAREFSRKVSPGVKLFDEFWQGLLEDARQVMPEDKMKKVTEEAQEALEMTRRFQEKMDRWSRGEVKPNEGPAGRHRRG